MNTLENQPRQQRPAGGTTHAAADNDKNKVSPLEQKVSIENALGIIEFIAIRCVVCGLVIIDLVFICIDKFLTLRSR